MSQGLNPLDRFIRNFELLANGRTVGRLGMWKIHFTVSPIYS